MTVTITGIYETAEECCSCGVTMQRRIKGSGGFTWDSPLLKGRGLHMGQRTLVKFVTPGEVLSP